MGDASGMYTSPTGARPQNGGAGQGQDNNEGFNNESFQLDGGDQHLESAGGRRTSTGTMATLAGGAGTPSPAQQEPQAQRLVVLKYLATALQVADMFTKQIFPKHFERLRRVMMGHENFDDMCERYQDAKAAGDNVDDPKLYTVKPVRPPNG